MASFNDWQQLLSVNKAIAVIRSPEMELSLAMALAVAAGGIRSIEITWNSDRPAESISRLRHMLPDCFIGTGTIINARQLQIAISAGSQFVFCPHFDRHLLDLALDRYQIPLIPGVLSPTEIVTAWQAGAKTVKVFPVKALGGAEYIRSLQGPLGEVNLIPTGGVTIDNASEILLAGAMAVGLSGNLFLRSLVRAKNWQAITARTQILLTKLNPQ